MSDKNYISSKVKFLKYFDKSIARARYILVSRYGEELACNLIKESRQEYEALIPQIPYIGEKSPFLIFLLPTVRGLAVYRVLQRHGKSIDDAGQLIYEMSEAQLNAAPVFLRRIIGYVWFSKWFLRRVRKRATESQEREYPANFVMHFIEGDGKNFDYGIDYTECANVKFLKAQGALKLAPYICATDKVVSVMLGWGLSRTMTLADSYAKCDFRFRKGGKTSI